MKRLILALACASASFGSSAAEKPLPVTVTNPVVPVEVIEPVRFQREKLLIISQGTTAGLVSVFDVPADKTAIVKFVSGRGFTAVDSWVTCEVVQMSGGAPLVTSHVTLVQKRLRSPDYSHEFSQEMEFYVEGGLSAGFRCITFPAPVSATGTIFSVNMTGILVDAQ